MLKWLALIHATLSELRRRAARWTLEHQQVAVAASELNLQRLHQVCVSVALINSLFVLGLIRAVWLDHGDSLAANWKLASLVTHLLMGLSFVALAWTTRVVQLVPNTRWGRTLPLLVVLLGLLFVAGLAAIGQWVTPSFTPYVIGVVAASMAMVLRPVSSAWVYALAYFGFAYAIGLTQLEADALLSNRIQGLAITLLA